MRSHNNAMISASVGSFTSWQQSRCPML